MSVVVDVSDLTDCPTEVVDVSDLTDCPTEVVDVSDLTDCPTFSIGSISYRYFTPFADSVTFSVASQTVLFLS